MRFTVEIPDELFRSANSISPAAVSVTSPDAASDAMSGGAGPGAADGGAVALGQTPEEFSAGPAQHQVAPVGPENVTEAIRDGGPAPGTR